jgi:hypothetical protein
MLRVTPEILDLRSKHAEKMHADRLEHARALQALRMENAAKRAEEKRELALLQMQVAEGERKASERQAARLEEKRLAEIVKKVLEAVHVVRVHRGADGRIEGIERTNGWVQRVRRDEQGRVDGLSAVEADA